MKHVFSISMLLAGTLLPPSRANVDNDFFHPAAGLFIHGDTVTARNLTERGLAEYPGNEKLLRFKELLEQQEKEERQNQNEPRPGNQQQEQPSGNDEDAPPQGEPENQQPLSPVAGEMSADEANRLLEAMHQDEETQRRRLKPVHGAPVRVEKDW